MLQVCIFGGHEGRLEASKRVVLTLFGGCDLRRPTLARQLLWLRHRDPHVAVTRKRHVAITLFGATEIKVPTLAEEYIDMRELLRSGRISTVDWDALMADLTRAEDQGFWALTMFGAFEECSLPTEDEEVDGLAVQCHLGNIPEEAGGILQYGVGLRDSQRRAVVLKAVAAEAALPA
jgi:hypothetical protein